MSDFTELSAEIVRDAGIGARDGAPVARFLDELSMLADTGTPAPSDELLALLAGAPPLPATRPARQASVARRLAVAAAILLLAIVSTLTRELPQPARKLVSDVVNTVTPFHVDSAPLQRLGRVISRQPAQPPVARRAHRTPVVPSGHPSSGSGSADSTTQAPDQQSSGSGSGVVDQQSAPIVTVDDTLVSGGGSEPAGESEAGD